jgi:hypothetical protein
MWTKSVAVRAEPRGDARENSSLVVAHVLEHLDRDDAVELGARARASFMSQVTISEVAEPALGGARVDELALRAGVGDRRDARVRVASAIQSESEPQPQPSSRMRSPSASRARSQTRCRAASSAAPRALRSRNSGQRGRSSAGHSQALYLRWGPRQSSKKPAGTS